MKKNIINTLRIMFGIAILVFLIYTIGVGQIIGAFKALSLLQMLIGTGIIVFPWTLGALAIYVLTRRINKAVPFRRITKQFVRSWIFGLFSPGRVGELSLIYFLKKEGFDTGQAAAVTIIDKVITTLSLAILAIFGAAFFLSSNQATRMIIAIVVIIILTLTFMISKKARELVKKLMIKRYREKVASVSENIDLLIKSAKGAIMLNAVITFLKWMINAAIVSLIVYLFGFNISFITVLLINSVVTAISLVPITASGLGVKESAAVFLFNSVGVPGEVAASIYLFFLILRYAFAGIATIISK